MFVHSFHNFTWKKPAKQFLRSTSFQWFDIFCYHTSFRPQLATSFFGEFNCSIIRKLRNLKVGKARLKLNHSHFDLIKNGFWVMWALSRGNAVYLWRWDLLRDFDLDYLCLWHWHLKDFNGLWIFNWIERFCIKSISQSSSMIFPQIHFHFIQWFTVELSTQSILVLSWYSYLFIYRIDDNILRK